MAVVNGYEITTTSDTPKNLSCFQKQHFLGKWYCTALEASGLVFDFRGDSSLEKKSIEESQKWITDYQERISPLNQTLEETVCWQWGNLGVKKTVRYKVEFDTSSRVYSSCPYHLTVTSLDTGTVFHKEYCEFPLPHLQGPITTEDIQEVFKFVNQEFPPDTILGIPIYKSWGDDFPKWQYAREQSNPRRVWDGEKFIDSSYAMLCNAAPNAIGRHIVDGDAIGNEVLPRISNQAMTIYQEIEDGFVSHTVMLVWEWTNPDGESYYVSRAGIIHQPDNTFRPVAYSEISQIVQ